MDILQAPETRVRVYSPEEAQLFAQLQHVDMQDVVNNAFRNWNLRTDAGETAVFTRQLEQIMSEVYMTEYTPTKFRQLLPVSSEISNAVPIYTYRQFEEFGTVGIVSDSGVSDDYPEVEIQGVEVTNKCTSLGISYGYNLQDLRAAAFLGSPVDSMKAQACRNIMERYMDNLACNGGGPTSTALEKGFSNAANILSQTKGSQKNGTTWQDSNDVMLATPAEILADVHAMCRKVFVTTKTIHEVDTLVLGTKGYAMLAAKPQSPSFTDNSIMTYILRMSPWIKSIECWPALDAAGSGGKERIMAYKKSPRVVKVQIPQELEQFPAQATNLRFKVLCHARWGGVQVFIPSAICYMDGTQP